MSNRLTMCPETHIPEVPCRACGLDQRPAQAALRAAAGDPRYYIVIPASPWGGQPGVLGPYAEDDARRNLAGLLDNFLPECPPKLLRLVEDYGEAG